MKISKKFLKGFTLIELLVVISIIGILATLITLNYKNSRIKARDAKRKQDLSTYSSALESYFDDYNFYPRVDTSCKAAAVLTATSTFGVDAGIENPGGIHYLQSLLDDPLVKNIAISSGEWIAPKNESKLVEITGPVIKRVTRKLGSPATDTKLKVFCRYAYLGGGESSALLGQGTIFSYNLSACMENGASKFSEQDGGLNPYRYEVGPGRAKTQVCAAYHTFTFIEGGIIDIGTIFTLFDYDCRLLSTPPS